MIVYLDNLDDRDGCVLCYLQGKGAEDWAAMDQSIAGAHWEYSDEDDGFAYALPLDHPGLIDELESEGYELNLDEYCPPDE